MPLTKTNKTGGLPLVLSCLSSDNAFETDAARGVPYGEALFSPLGLPIILHNLNIFPMYTMTKMLFSIAFLIEKHYNWNTI